MTTNQKYMTTFVIVIIIIILDPRYI